MSVRHVSFPSGSPRQQRRKSADPQAQREQARMAVAIPESPTSSSKDGPEPIVLSGVARLFRAKLSALRGMIVALSHRPGRTKLARRQMATSRP
jgi:hypothetical protein